MRFTRKQLIQICASLRVVLPGPKKGSGKNGGRVLIDYVRALVRYLLPDATAEEIEQQVTSIVGKKASRVDVSVLAMISEMSVDNADSFKELKQQAMQEFEKTVYGRGKKHGAEGVKDEQKRAEAKRQAEEAQKKREDKQESLKAAERRKQWDLTPPDLKTLLLGGGTITSTFWARYQPLQNFFKVDYPIGHLACFQYCVALPFILESSSL